MIRHAQASFGADDYDVLSNSGETQARMLGEHLARTGTRLDAMYIGPRRRHLDTARHMAAGAGDVLPAPVVVDGLDEYPLFDLFKRWLPALVAEEPALAAALTAQAGERMRLLDRALELVSGKWVRGELPSEGIESFAEFDGRVQGALDRVMREQGRSRTVAVVTSGGPVAVAMRRALRLDEMITMRVAWVLANTSITEFRYRGADDFSLIGFNHVPHLTDRSLITYR